MTLASDPSDLTPRPRPGRSRVLTPMVWVWLTSCAVCIVGGAVVGLYGAKLFPVAPVAADSAGAARPAVTETPPVAAVSGPPAATQPGAVAAETAALAARLDKLEADHRAITAAAAAALATASLSQASESGRPFVTELNTVSRFLSDPGDLTALRPLAERGVPTRAVLVAEFPEMARRASFAAKTPPEGSGLLTRINHALSALFTIRRVNRLTGSDPDAILARAERKVNDGDLEGAVHDVESLPANGATAAKVWLDRARSRAEVQRQVAAIRLKALRSLVAVEREAGQ
jgi:hypothetical protein